MKRAIFTINNTGLHFDRNYGIDKRTGWSVLIGGCFVVQFVSFWKALYVLLTHRPNTLWVVSEEEQ